MYTWKKVAVYAKSMVNGTKNMENRRGKTLHIISTQCFPFFSSRMILRRIVSVFIPFAELNSENTMRVVKRPSPSAAKAMIAGGPGATLNVRGASCGLPVPGAVVEPLDLVLKSSRNTVATSSIIALKTAALAPYTPTPKRSSHSFGVENGYSGVSREHHISRPWIVIEIAKPITNSENAQHIRPTLPCVVLYLRDVSLTV